MQTIDLDYLLGELRGALEKDDLSTAISLLESLRSPDRADLFAELDEEDQTILLPQLDPADSADILEELHEEEAAKLIGTLSPEAIIPIVQEMEPDEAADLLGDIPAAQAQTILEALEEPEEIRPLLLHPDDSAGGIMTSEFLVLRRRMTAREAIQAIHDWQPETESIYFLFVVDQHGILCGTVSLRQLIIANPDALILDIMDPDVLSVPAGVDQEEAARIMARYDLLALPVVDSRHVLLGVITIDDVIEVLEEEATEDIQRFGGAQPLIQPYLDTSILTVMRKRVGWLMLLFVTGSLTGTVLRYFEADLQAVVALAFFIPLLIGTGGNAGSQTTSTIIRALAVGDVDLGDESRALLHEVGAGLLLGLAMAAIAYLRATTWGTGPNLALAVALAILAIVIWANGLGALLPFIAARVHLDPTVVSGPVMSTLVDTTGLLIYFTIAQAVLRL